MEQLWYLFEAFFRVGLFSFGGGYAMLPLIQREVVVLHHWITSQQFIDVVALSQATPGPIATSAATFVGYKVVGLPGAIVATLGVLAPSLLISYTIARFAVSAERNVALSGFFRGIRPVVVSLMVLAALQMAAPALTDVKAGAIAAVTVVLGIGFKVNPVLLILGAGIVGALIY